MAESGSAPLLPHERATNNELNAYLSPSQVCPKKEYEASPTRWYILAVFSLFSFNQCLVWFTFSSIKAPKVYQYYSGNATATSHMDDSTLALLLNWGPIVGCLFFPIQVYLLTLSKGFRKATMLGAALVFGGTLIRFIPSLMSAEWRHTSSLSILCLHVGQVLNAAGTLILIKPYYEKL